MPYNKIDDPAKLRRLITAVLMIEADVELAILLRHLVEEACSLVDARYGALGVLNEARTGLEQFLTVGLSEEEEQRIGPRPTGRGVLGLLITDPEALRLHDLGSHAFSYGFPDNHPPMTSFLGLPVRVRGGVYGNLYLTDKRDGGDFSDEDEAMAEALAVAAGIAIENTRLSKKVQILSVLEDRDRIARDLHDNVIQRIFAAGLSLQSATRLEDKAAIVERVDKAVDALDATITEIRSAIFELGDGGGPRGLRRGVLDLADELSPLLGSRPDVNLSGPIDNVVSQQIADHVLAVVREVSTNAGKHAQATRFMVKLDVGDGTLRLSVTDDGAGIDVSGRRRGMGLDESAKPGREAWGTFSIEPLEGGGTQLAWTVPC